MLDIGLDVANSVRKPESGRARYMPLRVRMGRRAMHLRAPEEASEAKGEAMANAGQKKCPKEVSPWGIALHERRNVHFALRH
jgi:hypothetical protein